MIDKETILNEFNELKKHIITPRDEWISPSGDRIAFKDPKFLKTYNQMVEDALAKIKSHLITEDVNVMSVTLEQYPEDIDSRELNQKLYGDDCAWDFGTFYWLPQEVVAKKHTNKLKYKPDPDNPLSLKVGDSHWLAFAAKGKGLPEHFSIEKPTGKDMLSAPEMVRHFGGFPNRAEKDLEIIEKAIKTRTVLKVRVIEEKRRKVVSIEEAFTLGKPTGPSNKEGAS